MMRLHLTALLVAGVGWMAMADRVCAAEPGEPAKKQEHLERLAVKLKLDDQQKDEIRKITADLDAQAGPLEQQLWALQLEQREAMKTVLTPEQRARMPEALKALADQQFEKAVAPLKLSDEQKAAIAKIRADYGPKFHELALSKDSGEHPQQFTKLRHQMVKAIRAQLNDEQRDKLPLVLREQHRFWHDPASRREVFNALGETLGVSAEQKQQFYRLHQEYEPKVRPLHAELRKLHQEEHAAIGRVLTDEQRAQWKELHQGQVGCDKSHDKE
jgi:Spy/CpxP family protein refolding chaperone